MAKGEERGQVDLLVVAVSDVDVLAVEDAAALGAEVQVGRIIL